MAFALTLTGIQRLVLANRLNTERIKNRGEDYRLRVRLWQQIRFSPEESERLGLDLGMPDQKELRSRDYEREVMLTPPDVDAIKALLDKAVETEGLTPAESEWFDPLYERLEHARRLRNEPPAERLPAEGVPGWIGQ